MENDIETMGRPISALLHGPSIVNGGPTTSLLGSQQALQTNIRCYFCVELHALCGLCVYTIEF